MALKIICDYRGVLCYFNRLNILHMGLASSWTNTIKYDGRDSRRGGGGRFLAFTLGLCRWIITIHLRVWEIRKHVCKRTADLWSGLFAFNDNNYQSTFTLYQIRACALWCVERRKYGLWPPTVYAALSNDYSQAVLLLAQGLQLLIAVSFWNSSRLPG